MESSGPGQDAGFATAENLETLPEHSMIGEFEILGIIGEGGFGTVYLAQDHSLQRQGALKEYRPAALATRRGVSVVVRSRRHAEAFASGLLGFISEARTLARFDHRALVRVFRVWQQNNTAYMAMALCEGQPLTQLVREQPDLITEAWLKAMLIPLLEAVEVLHNERIYHRDIAPDNILIQDNGAPILLDFGAARQIASDVTQALTVILKPGYAPIEQFADDASLKQGPWTDIYALAAVACFALTGKAPPNSVARLIKDPLQPLAGTISGYAPEFLGAIDKALSVRPEDRPQSIAEFRALLGLPAFTPARPRTRTTPAPSSAATARSPLGVTTVTRPLTTARRASGSQEHPPTMMLPRPTTQAPSDAPHAATVTAQAAAPVASRGRGMWIAAAGVLVVVLGVAGLLAGNALRSTAPFVDPATEPAQSPAKASQPASPIVGSASSADAEPQTAAPADAAAVVMGTVRISVKPWGEVSINGVNHGVSPPLKRLSLPEGKHMVEISNPGFPSHSTEIEVAKNKAVTVSYEFK